VIVVAGGTGRLGRLVVRGLAARGEQVRVLTRDPARATGLAGPRVEVLVADVGDAHRMIDVCAEARVVVSAVQGLAGPGRMSPAAVDLEGNRHLIDAAEAAGADVVLTSILDAGPEHPVPLFRMKAAAEASLRASRVSWTIVRPAAFSELHAEVLRDTAKRLGRPLVLGRGENPVNFVAVDDVAEVVLKAIVDPTMRGQVVEVAGPDNLTFNELAALAVPDSGSPRHVPRALLRLASILPGQPGRLVGVALAMDTLAMAVPADQVRRPEGVAITSIAGLTGPSHPRR
jgi:uncharacterized protein YbjT (DUF2867 family)